MIRFAPTRHDLVEVRAVRAWEQSGHHRLSVFADVPQCDESEESHLLARLIEAAGYEGVNLETNKWFFVCQASALLRHGFAFEKDGYPNERPEHYSVNIGPEEPQLRPMSVCLYLTAFADKRSLG